MRNAPLGPKLGAVIREQRHIRGWSQARLAEEIGVSTNYVGVLERGEKLPALDMLIRIAKLLGVTPGTLLGEASTPNEWTAQLIAAASNLPAELQPVLLVVIRAFHGLPVGRRTRR